MGLREVSRKECIELGLDPDFESDPKRPRLLAFLDSVPKATVPLSQMTADRDQLLAAAAALRKGAA
jgi:hypothetical protein